MYVGVEGVIFSILNIILQLVYLVVALSTPTVCFHYHYRYIESQDILFLVIILSLESI